MGTASKQLKFKEDLRPLLTVGIDKITDAVAVTMGPKSGLVGFDSPHGSPPITKDGVTVARQVTLGDRFENMGAELIKEASARTNAIAGDGTTATCVIARAIWHRALRTVGLGGAPVTVRKGIEAAVKRFVELLKERASDCSELEELKRIGRLAAYNEDLGNKVAELVHAGGKDCIVKIEDKDRPGIETERMAGLPVDSGWIDPHFVNNLVRNTCHLQNVMVLVVDGIVGKQNQAIRALETARKRDENAALLVLAEDVTGAALQAMVKNADLARRGQGGMACCAVRMPGLGSNRTAYMEDVCAVTGAKLVTEQLGMRLEDLQPDDFGHCEETESLPLRTVVSKGSGEKEKIDERIALVESQIENDDDDWNRDRLKERVSRMRGGIGVLRIGANVQTEQQELKQRADDSIHACLGALQEGTVPGGGSTLLNLADVLDDELADCSEERDWRDGWTILADALRAPVRQIAKNSGHVPEVVIERLRADDLLLNVDSGEYEQWGDTEITDPAIVLRSAAENAAAVAGLLVMMECAIVDEPEKESKDE